MKQLFWLFRLFARPRFPASALNNLKYILRVVFASAGLAATCLCQAEPWGKDADLVQKIQPKICCPSSSLSSSSLLTRWGEKAIHFHQEVISPADGPRSHFIPSSSQYTLDAMHKYGFFKGFTMGCDRLMRENDDPWVYQTTKDGAGYLMKWDPVR